MNIVMEVIDNGGYSGEAKHSHAFFHNQLLYRELVNRIVFGLGINQPNIFFSISGKEGG
jgi:hypothetical protein